MEHKPDELNSNFFTDVLQILQNARQKAYSAVNSAMVEAYWQIGRRIVEEEQQGQHKATYGEATLKTLSINYRQNLGRVYPMPTSGILDSFFLLTRTLQIVTHCVAI